MAVLAKQRVFVSRGVFVSMFLKQVDCGFSMAVRVSNLVGVGFISLLAYVGLYYHGVKDYDATRVQNSAGHFNRRINEGFIQEFGDGSVALEKVCQSKPLIGVQTGNVVSLDVFVADNVKSFFDDAGKTSDNYDWMFKVGECLEGLKKFSEFGDIDFRVNRVVPVVERYFVGMPESSPHFLYALHKRLASEQKANVAIYLRTGKIGMMPGDTVRMSGVSDYNSSFVLVNLSNSDRLNQVILVHEMAHIFGASHTSEWDINFMKLHCISVPSFGYVSWGDMMEPLVNEASPQSSWSGKTVDEVNANKYRFVKQTVRKF